MISPPLPRSIPSVSRSSDLRHTLAQLADDLSEEAYQLDLRGKRDAADVASTAAARVAELALALEEEESPASPTAPVQRRSAIQRSTTSPSTSSGTVPVPSTRV